jgi:hypothetical protein
VRHAYFTGGNDPYDQLRCALRADIDEDARATLNAAVSRPFPETGKIAIKVINHYGDEVLRVDKSDTAAAFRRGRGSSGQPIVPPVGLGS